ILFLPPSLSQFERLKLLLFHFSWDFRAGPHWIHRLSGHENRTLDTNANPPAFTFVDQFNRAGLQEQSTYTFRTGAVAAGYEYEVENAYPSLIAGFHARRNNQAGFLDARWQPLARLTLSAGARAEANTTFGTRVVPRAGAVYALDAGRGFNLSGQLRLRHWLSPDGNYSHDDTRVLKSPNAFDPVQMPGNHLLRRPVNSGSLILNTFYRHWNLNLTGYFSGIRTDSDFLGFGLTHNPGYARFDLATGYLIARGISFTGRVTNLFDKQYQDALGFPALGRDFRLGLNYRFTGRNRSLHPNPSP